MPKLSLVCLPVNHIEFCPNSNREGYETFPKSFYMVFQLKLLALVPKEGYRAEVYITMFLLTMKEMATYSPQIDCIQNGDHVQIFAANLSSLS